MFTDRVTIQLKAGKGGNGIVAWRREKYIPKGGPCGGNGGKGGSIVLEADREVYSLEAFRNRRLLKAENGTGGGPNCRQGRNGSDLVLKIPCGTLVKDAKTGQIIYDFTTHKEKLLISAGGRGGKGNNFFKTPTNRAPIRFTEGAFGEISQVELELKLIADVGLVGFPNAGKSTLLNNLTHVPVKIAPYPFTTLRPNLGYIYADYSRILIADIPGIIKGAHKNRGLGLEFLRHIERTHLLLFILDASGMEGRHPLEDFKTLQKELSAYQPALLEKPCLVILNKVDMEESAEKIREFRAKYPFDPKTLFEISALSGQGMSELTPAILEAFNAAGISNLASK